MVKVYEFAKAEIKLQTAESKYTNIKADFGTSFGFLCIGYNKTDHIRMTVLEQIGNITIRNSF